MTHFSQILRRKPSVTIFLLTMLGVVTLVNRECLSHQLQADRNVGAHSASSTSIAGEIEGKSPFQSKKHRPVSSVSSSRKRTLAESEDLIKNVMQKSEAERCRVLATYSDDNSDFTLVAIDPPNPDQIAEAREAISTLASECEKDFISDLDKRVTMMIEEYDPFGTMGRRAFFVTISKGDTDLHCSAFLFSVDNFEGLVEIVDPKSKIPYSMKNARWYQNPKGGVLDRLRDIMEPGG